MQRILNKNLRRVLPLKLYVPDIANRLLRDCSVKSISKN
jgi:hypothetical protein